MTYILYQGLVQSHNLNSSCHILRVCSENMFIDLPGVTCKRIQPYFAFDWLCSSRCFRCLLNTYMSVAAMLTGATNQTRQAKGESNTQQLVFLWKGWTNQRQGWGRGGGCQLVMIIALYCCTCYSVTLTLTIKQTTTTNDIPEARGLNKLNLAQRITISVLQTR